MWGGGRCVLIIRIYKIVCDGGGRFAECKTSVECVLTVFVRGSYPLTKVGRALALETFVEHHSTGTKQVLLVNYRVLGWQRIVSL